MTGRGPLRLAHAGALLFLLAACAGPRAAAPPAPPATVGFEEAGDASWYGPPYHGRRTASGEVYDMHQMTAAHQTLPLGTWVAVENLANGRVTDVRINDRGPFARGRILDLSYAAARMLGAVGPGVIQVRLRVLSVPTSAPAAAPQASGGHRPPVWGGAFSVQVGSFSAEDRAQALQNELARDWPGSFIQRAGVGGRIVYRVRVGKFVTRQEAQRLAEQLAAAGHAVIVVED